MKGLIIFLLVSINYCYGDDDGLWVDLYDYELAPKRSDCGVPTEGNIHSCNPPKSYPSNKTICKCFRNNQTISLFCISDSDGDPMWVRGSREFPCNGAWSSTCHVPKDINIHSCNEIIYPNSKTTCKCGINKQRNINLFCWKKTTGDPRWCRENINNPCSIIDSNSEELITSNDAVVEQSTANEKCYTPEEDLYRIHSCRKGGYPSEQTTCHCANNYEKMMNLVCLDKKWYLHQKSTADQCTDENNTYVYLIRSVYKPNGLCNKPEEFLNVFHSCERKAYPSDLTSCTCTYNPESKMNLVCSGSYWYRHGPDHPCNYNFLPNIVRCTRDENTKEIICNCINNCFTLDISRRLSYDEIYRICDVENQLHYSKTNSLYAQYTSSTGMINYWCSSGYNLVGSNKLQCRQGKLSESLPKCTIGCGLPKGFLDTVVSGEDVHRGEFPWLTTIFKISPQSKLFHCAGSLISDRHILTAAHCTALKPREVLRVVLGKHELFPVIGYEDNNQEFAVKEILRYPDYGKMINGLPVRDVDIAILVLERRAIINDYVRPVCVHYNTHQTPSNTLGVVVGWGLDETGGVTGFPKKVALPIVSLQQCRDSDKRFFDLTSERTFCAGFRNGSGPCLGDSGGGFYTLAGERYRLDGIVSRSLPRIVISSPAICDLSHYTIYVKVFAFRNWLQNTIGDELLIWNNN